MVLRGWLSVSVMINYVLSSTIGWDVNRPFTGAYIECCLFFYYVLVSYYLMRMHQEVL